MILNAKTTEFEHVRRETSCYSECQPQKQQQIIEDREIVNEIFSEIGLSQDAVSMVSLTRIKPNPSRITTNPPPLRMTLIDNSYSYRSIEDALSAAKQLKGSV